MPLEWTAPRARAALILYLAVVVLLSAVHDRRPLAGALILTLALAGGRAPALTRRVLLAAGPFCALVSLSYAGLALAGGRGVGAYLLSVNLRVAALAALTFLVAERVPLGRALAFSRTLGYLLTLATSQALTLRRVVEDYRLALQSRTLARLPLKDRYRHGAASVARLMDKALHESAEIALAMRARGFFDDPPLAARQVEEGADTTAPRPPAPGYPRPYLQAAEYDDPGRAP